MLAIQSLPHSHLLDRERERQLCHDERDIGHSQGDRVLVAVDAQVGHEAGRLCIADITAIWRVSVVCLDTVSSMGGSHGAPLQ